MTNLAKRFFLSFKSSIIKHVFLLLLFLFILDFQHDVVNADGTHLTVKKGSKSAKANARKSSKNTKTSIKRSKNVADHEDESDDSEWDDEHPDGDYLDEEFDMENYSEPEYEELEFEPIGNEIENPWISYMEKFDIPQVHGSGIYVDLGGSSNFNKIRYRMTAGKCPVFGKIIEFDNGTDYLSPANDSTHPGFGFPYTNKGGKNTSMPTKTSRGRISIPKNASSTDLLSPVTAKILKIYEYEGDDIYKCASYANELQMASDSSSKYKYPFAFDQESKICHIVYSSLQYLQNPRFCNPGGNHKSSDKIRSCIHPTKDINQKMVYGSSFIRKDWEKKCPKAAVADAVFGTWNGTACVPIPPVRVFNANTPEMCGQIVFRYSASDISTDFKHNMNEPKGFSEVLNALFPLATAPNFKSSKGKGLNWANYDKEKSVCELIDTVPNCLVFKMNSIAFTALGSPLEEDMESFPCDIKSIGFVTKGNFEDRSSYFLSSTHQDLLPNRSKLETLNAHSCTGYYGSIEEDGGGHLFSYFANYYYFIWPLAAVIALLALFFIFKRFTNRPFKKSDALLNKFDEFEHSNYKGWTSEENIETNNDFWENPQQRPSEVTPIRIERIEY